ncbi:6-phosphofructo-2-kinase/fructose-2,6-bisphosphatase-like [Iris pallida]|uniref:6-phosphofructo-2-kinase/fructose-2, 6-bisphosphatase-like n=1 Tax=Iris pallida TaxID=29817 RepID=A0AAX6E3M5_IRIPA|nr:6-phosphofructo-2-kinase/fructose-2,6-bisphosphatase-like [Iris pallida]
MGTNSSKNPDGERAAAADGGDGVGGAGCGGGGGQLYVSLKMENFRLRMDLVPHVFGSSSVVGSWDSSRALPMEKESASMWELSFVVPSNHETLDFKFLLKPKYNPSPCIVEEGPDRLLTGGNLEGDARTALFRLGGEEEEVLVYKVFIKSDIISPFDLAASWRAYQENLQPSTVRGIPDVSISAGIDAGNENCSSASLELDLEHYLVPSPALAGSSVVYAANLTENPRSLGRTGVFSKSDASSSGLHVSSHSCVDSSDHFTSRKDFEVIIPDPSKVFRVSGMVESKSVGTFSPLQKQDGQRGLFVDRGVGSSRLVRSASASPFTTSESETKKAMPAAAGAVAAAAVADQMLGPKEDSSLAIVLVGLPARGKTFTAAKLTRYLRWLGHETKHFNVGKYRRLKHGVNQSADFFRADNPEGMEARNEVAALAMEDMISWMQEGGQVGIFDATNSTRQRRIC